ncbi:MAG: carbamoyltransferase HypF [Methanomassiliicoccaceae archaeon]|jgi:hydrogenase maturation protein HypF|nr:carbamoyltransferase HypF [Methanomassiliicoccaceae archaeon]
MRIVIRGIVQGVGFRPTVHRVASSLKLNGCVWNDGPDVVIDVDNGDLLLNSIYPHLPTLSRIDDVIIEDREYTGERNGFHISRSKAHGAGVSIPSDTAVCDNCLKDMRVGRRRGYPFTTCTECGARFTLLSSLPYDRANTAMSEFGMCDACTSEYTSPEDRRFHHQTICCNGCGPGYSLYDTDKNIIPGDPITQFGKMIDSGKIGIIKGMGGMHICSRIDNIVKVREWYRRSQKPFAVMVKDLDSVFRYADPTEHELKEVTSRYRPIVLIRKKVNDITELISPGLDSMGIFLPYAGVHHLLFDSMDTDALIMTSANIPGSPMILNDDTAFGMSADCYLLHDQKIINRADDTVLRMQHDRTSFLRRSRGYTPSHIETEYNGNVLALGAQENIVASVASGNRIHQTQYIGDHDSEGVAEYLEDASLSLMRMVGCTPDIVAVDLHPGYGNRRFAKRICEEMRSELMEVQHHWAHCASLFAEHGKDDGVVLTLDGTGYGDDGNAWGGEVMYADHHGYKRLAHLQNIPLLGSEKALYDLRRLKFAYDDINGINSGLFSDTDSAVLRKMAPKSVKTSSLGRLLDALAFTLDVCKERTYDGEPAMKLEPLLARGKMITRFETDIVGKEIMTAPLFALINGKERKEDVAYSIVKAVIGQMVNVACDTASLKGLDEIGVSGGVSYNGPICEMINDEAEKRGIAVMHHSRIPNGDGGISTGQAMIALGRLQ